MTIIKCLSYASFGLILWNIYVFVESWLHMIKQEMFQEDGVKEC